MLRETAWWAIENGSFAVDTCSAQCASLRLIHRLLAWFVPRPRAVSLNCALSSPSSPHLGARPVCWGVARDTKHARIFCHPRTTPSCNCLHTRNNGSGHAGRSLQRGNFYCVWHALYTVIYTCAAYSVSVSTSVTVCSCVSKIHSANTSLITIVWNWSVYYSVDRFVAL